MKHLQTLLLLATTAYAATSSALPSLQLGGDGSSAWSYDSVTETWVASGTNSFDVLAYANCESGVTGCNSPNGDFAWDADGATDRYAYLTVATMPDIGNVDGFDITVTGASLVDSGYGNPPIEDPNSMSPHSIFDTYFEIYEFQFDGPIVNITDQQPGGTGSGDGYSEAINITINSLFSDDVTGIHFDLFTVEGTRWDPTNTTIDKFLVEAVAPYSHDAEWTVPEPGVLALLGLGLVGIGMRRYIK